MMDKEYYLISEYGYSKIGLIARKIRPYIVFTALNTVWINLLKDSYGILDVGCGKGEPMRFIGCNNRFYTIGVDIFLPYLKFCKKQKIHSDYVQCDVRYLPFNEKSFDVTICMQLLEHLGKTDGYKLLTMLEALSCRQVFISTPVGEHEQSAYDGNAYQEHKWIWTPSQLAHFGYAVRGFGVRNIGGDNGLVSHIPKFFKPFSDTIYIFAGLLTYFIPYMGGQMVCIKNISSKEFQ